MTTLLAFVRALIWPAVLIGLVWFFRKPLREALSRVSGLTLMGQRVELSMRIRDARRWTRPGTGVQTPAAREEKELFELAKSKPGLALEQAQLHIEREVKLYAASGGRAKSLSTKTLNKFLFELAREEGYEEGFLRLLFDYVDLNDYLQDAHAEPTDHQAEGALGVYVRILGFVEGLSREVHTVKQAGIALYDDPGCSTRCTHGMAGVRVVTHNKEAEPPDVDMVFMADRRYELDSAVSWEWIIEHERGRHYFLDSRSENKPSETTTPWLFVGRDMTTI